MNIAVCPHCGTDGCDAGFVENDVIPAEALFWRARVVEQGGRVDVEPEWAGETDVDWDGQRPDPTRPRYRCLGCGREFEQFQFLTVNARVE